MNWRVPLSGTIILVLGACASHVVEVPPDGSTSANSWRDVPQASTRDGGIAHLCPYSAHQAYTARHVVLDFEFGRLWLIPVNWGQGDQGGTLFPLMLDARRDLALGCSNKPFPRWFERAAGPPNVGDKVHVPVYDWFKKGAPRNEIELTVAEVVGGTIRFESSPNPGSSGACILDDENRIVAIASGGLPGLTSFGMAVWGKWGEIPPEWRDSEKYGWLGASEAAKGCAAEALEK